MKITGAKLLVHALEKIGVRYTFGIPGVHNTEIYDELNKSESITPVLVTHEGGGAFMADAVSRTSDSIGTLVIVPAAGMTHAMSGIGEAYLDGIPMLVISGGIRRDTGRSFQLHQLDQQQILNGIVKHACLVEEHRDIIPQVYEAYRIANEGDPGPVFVEIPVNLQLFRGEVDSLPDPPPPGSIPVPKGDAISRAATLLREAKAPGIFVGWGARDCGDLLVKLAEKISAPVSTTLQGLSVFPANHPLHTGMGFGPYSVPAAEQAFANCDCLLALGARFGEIPTGSFGMEVPENLIHGDINADVFNKNYPAKEILHGDAKEIVRALLEALEESPPSAEQNGVRDVIQREKQNYQKEWLAADQSDRVNPARFFTDLRTRLADTDILVVDDGNHTFLAAELYPVQAPETFISPTDFNCMGYAVPASIGAKLANPEKTVAAVVGDGAFLMTCMELLTATTLGLGLVIFVFHDGELSQISQGQEIPYNRKTCTVLGELKIEGVAQSTGAAYLEMRDNDAIAATAENAFRMAGEGRPVIVDVRIDYSKRTRFTKGVVKINLARFPLGEKFRFIGRALVRKVTG